MSILAAVLAKRPSGTVIGPHRYWRVYITANGGDPSYVLIQGGSAWHSTVSGPPLTISSASASNTAAGSPITSWQSNTANAWQANWPGPQWNSVDLGSPIAVVELVLQGATSPYNTRNASTFQIQYSDDNSTWSIAQTQTGLTWASNEVKTFRIQ